MAEGARLESVYAGKRIEGSNPSPSASYPRCPSSKHLGLLSLLFSGGFGSSWFNVKPLVVGGSSGVSG